MISIHPEPSLNELIPLGDLKDIIQMTALNERNEWHFPEYQYNEYIKRTDDSIDASLESQDYNEIWRFYQNGHF
ncbi:MAG: hypothetical protein ACFFD2_21845, partial [Promethearchaeota archaeon]